MKAEGDSAPETSVQTSQTFTHQGNPARQVLASLFVRNVQTQRLGHTQEPLAVLCRMRARGHSLSPAIAMICRPGRRPQLWPNAPKLANGTGVPQPKLKGFESLRLRLALYCTVQL